MTGKGMNIFRIPIMMYVIFVPSKAELTGANTAARERAIPSQLTGSINETYFSGLTDVS